MTTRALLHDVRGVLGAASSNVEFLRAQHPEGEPVLEEIAHELRLVADVIALTGAAEDERVVELDLRALLLFRRGESSFAIDATQPPFPLTASRRALSSFAAELVAAAPRGAGIEVTARGCTVYGLDPATAERLRGAGVLAEASIDATVESGSLILRRKD